jgi:hypothetical protein
MRVAGRHARARGGAPGGAMSAPIDCGEPMPRPINGAHLDGQMRTFAVAIMAAILGGPDFAPADVHAENQLAARAADLLDAVEAMTILSEAPTVPPGPVPR